MLLLGVQILLNYGMEMPLTLEQHVKHAQDLIQMDMLVVVKQFQLVNLVMHVQIKQQVIMIHV